MSNWGRVYRSGGLLAPGAGLVGAQAGGGTLVVSGTSFAAALVSGAAGLLLSLALKWGRHIDGRESVRFCLTRRKSASMMSSCAAVTSRDGSIWPRPVACFEAWIQA